LTVIAPMEDTPAFEAGIANGDQILKIDGKTTEHMTMTDAVKMLRGDSGSKVTLTITRSSFNAPKDFVLTRQDIRLFSVKDINNHRDFPVGPDKIGYVRLTQFGEHTAEELESAMTHLEGQGMESIVMDLRGNPGGLLDQAVAVCEKFLERGQPIVSTEGRNKAADVQRVASGRGRVRAKLPMVILVNGGSASAAEIVSGCLQDLKRAVIVGEQTFGKGSVQNILPLSDGSALRLTTAKYYTPSHKVIHEHGITPDIPVAMTEDEDIAIQLRRLPGVKSSLDDALKFYPSDRQGHLRELVESSADPQLERARDLLKGVQMFSKRQQQEKNPVRAPAALN
jgi:carboxyl-terminal processing protease